MKNFFVIIQNYRARIEAFFRFAWIEWTRKLTRLYFTDEEYDPKNWESFRSFIVALIWTAITFYIVISFIVTGVITAWLCYELIIHFFKNNWPGGPPQPPFLGTIWLFESWFSAGNLINLLCLIILGTTVSFLATQNPIYSLLFLMFIFFNVILLLLTINVEFLALSLLIIYVGAVAILFLFVIMMFNLKKLQKGYHLKNYIYIALAYALLFSKTYGLITSDIGAYLLSAIWQLDDSKSLLYNLKYQTNDILLFSDFLYSHFNYDVLLAGVILVTAMLGSIFLVFLTLGSTQQKRI